MARLGFPTGVLSAAIAVLVLAGPASGFDSARERDNLAKTRERTSRGPQASAEFQRQLALQSLSSTFGLPQAIARNPAGAPANPCATGANVCAGDVRLYDFGGRYGIVRPLRFVNRNGATLSAHLWAPLPRRGRRVRPLPAVVIVNGDLAPEQLYWWAAQSLARAGYVVMTFDPQGHGRSDTYGAGVDRDRHVADQQSAGAGDDAALDADAVEQTEDALDFLLSGPRRRYLPVGTDGRPPHRGRAPTSGQLAQRDRAAAGSVARFDPLRRLVDSRRIGLAGHSRGADAVSIAGTRDRRVKAIVAWDDLLAVAGDPPRRLRPRVPALGMSADYYETPTPYTADPDPRAKGAGFAAYRRAHVDAMEVVIRGGTHYEWSYAPSPAFPATLRGIDLAAWYTQAWFDKYLRGARSADRRLLSDRWRGDRPEAAVDPRRDGNAFSFYFRSSVAIHRFAPSRRGRPARGRLVACRDLRAGCRALDPRRRDGFRGEYSYFRARGG